MLELVLLLQVGTPTIPAFVPTHLSLRYTQHLAASPRVVFPLLGPVGEKKWATGWEPQFVFPAAAGADEAGVVFTVPAHGRETLWVLNTFDDRRLLVEYVQFTPGVRVALLRINLAPGVHSDEATAEISYTWTALSKEGNDWVEAHAKHFEQGMSEWEKELNAYLASSRVK